MAILILILISELHAREPQRCRCGMTFFQGLNKLAVMTAFFSTCCTALPVSHLRTHTSRQHAQRILKKIARSHSIVCYRTVPSLHSLHVRKLESQGFLRIVHYNFETGIVKFYESSLKDKLIFKWDER